MIRAVGTSPEGRENAERFDVDANLVKAVFWLLVELNNVEQRETR